MTRRERRSSRAFERASKLQRVSVMVRTRLDTVVRLREREEEQAAQAVAKAETVVRQAMEKHEEARARQMRDLRARQDVSHWETAELAHHRALEDARRAEREVVEAKKSAHQVRALYTSAHQRAEVVRRAAETRRDELRREEGRRESRQLDEVASLLFTRKAG